jgi:hypothetical protein
MHDSVQITPADAGKSFIYHVNSFLSTIREQIRRLSLETKIVLAVFIMIFIFMFWRIGSYPGYFNNMVDHMIYVQVSKVLDHTVVSETTKWYWTSMHSHGAVESPLYGIVIEIGLRLFGLTLFGVRIIPALIEFLALILAYLALRKYFSKYLLLSIILLLALSPWHLITARSGGIYGFSISLYIIVLSMFALLIEKKRAVGLAVLAGVSAAIIPYGYSSIRLLLPFLVFLAIINHRKIEKYNLYTYLSIILVVCSIQISNLPESLNMYFFARGEGLNNVAKLADGSYNIPFIIQKLKENFTCTYNLILGRSESGFFNVNIAKNCYAPDVVLYPKFLVPFLIIGFIYCVIHIFKKKRPVLIMPVLLFCMGLLPNMMSGIGVPDLLRSIMLLIPIYFLIGYGVYSLFGTIYCLVGNQFRKTLPPIFLIFILLVSTYQVNNFYSYEKDSNAKNVSTTFLYREFLHDYINDHPQAKILLHEFGPFHEHSYVNIRWLGGKIMQKKIADGQIKFLRVNNIQFIDKLIRQKYFDIIATTVYQDLEEMIPDTKFLPAETFSCYRIYYIR